MLENLARRAGASNIQIRSHAVDRSIEGRRLDAIARDRLIEPVDAAIGIIEAGGAQIVSFNMEEADIRAFMLQPWTMTCSDGQLVAPGDGVPHPRSYGPFPRKIRRYVVEQNVLSLEQAVHSMTGLSASVLRLRDRGVLRPGAFADVVVFDLSSVRDRATYEKPHQLRGHPPRLRERPARAHRWRCYSAPRGPGAHAHQAMNFPLNFTP
jgi:N-acyl-D-aspartate/D-glutamate deacylase